MRLLSMPADVEMPLVLAHRGDHRVVLAAEIPHHLQNAPLVVEAQDASRIDVRKQPLVGRHAPRHPPAEARHLQSEIQGGRAHSHQGQPIGAVGCPIDVVGVSREIGDDRLDGAGLRAVEIVPAHPAAPGLGEHEGDAVMRHADPVREDQVPQHGARGFLVRVVADDPAVAPRFQAIHGPFMHLVADGRFAEEDAAVPARYPDRRPA